MNGFKLDYLKQNEIAGTYKMKTKKKNLFKLLLNIV